MTTTATMLNSAAAQVLGGVTQRIHITDRQLYVAGETKTTLETWAASLGLAVSRGECCGWAGWWIKGGSTKETK